MGEGMGWGSEPPSEFEKSEAVEGLEETQDSSVATTRGNVRQPGPEAAVENWTNEELLQAVNDFLAELDAHTEDMRRRMEAERQAAMESVRIEEEEINARIEQEADGLDSESDTYEEELAKLKLRKTLEYMIETGAERWGGIIMRAIRSLRDRDQD